MILPMLRLVTVLAVSALVAVACDSDTRSSDNAAVRDTAGVRDVATVVRDSAGVQIILSDLSDVTSWPACALSTEPRLRIGRQDADPMLQFFGVEDARRLADGRIVVVNRWTQELRVFDTTGAFLSTIGRDGEGPGEFRDPVEVSVLLPDSLVVWDWGLGRISVFTSDGTFVRSLLLQPPVLNPTGDFEVLSGDTPLVVASHDVRSPRGTEPVLQRLLLLRYDRMGALTDTIAVLPYGVLSRVPGLSRTAVGRPMFQARGSFTVSGNLILTANGSDPVIHVWYTNRTLRRVIRWEPPDRGVSAAEVEEYRRTRLARARSENERRSTLRRLDALPVTDLFPAVREMKTDPAGYIWVRRYPRPTWENRMWFGFDAGGAFRCAMAVPQRLTVFQFGPNYVLGKTVDELGVEYVELYDLHW